MTTFLGTEKYAVIAVLLCLAVCGVGLIVWWAVRSTWTMRDTCSIALLVAVLAGMGTYVVIHPSWPVTPLNWLLK